MPLLENLDQRFWKRTRRATRWLLVALPLAAVTGPTVRDAITFLQPADLLTGTAPQAALRGTALLVSTIGALLLARLVAAAETRRGAALLTTAALLSGLIAFYSSMQTLTLVASLTNFQLPTAVMMHLPPVIERALELCWFVCVAGGIATVGFVTRRWVVLGAPTIVLAVASQLGLLLQSCPNRQLHPLCRVVAQPAANYRLALPCATLALVALSWVLLLVVVGERHRSIRRVALGE